MNYFCKAQRQKIHHHTRAPLAKMTAFMSGKLKTRGVYHWCHSQANKSAFVCQTQSWTNNTVMVM